MFAVESEADAHRFERYGGRLFDFRGCTTQPTTLRCGQRSRRFEQMVAVAHFADEDYQRQCLRGVETVEGEHILLLKFTESRRRTRCTGLGPWCDDPFVAPRR